MEYLVHPAEPKNGTKPTFRVILGLRFSSKETLKHQVLDVPHEFTDTISSTPQLLYRSVRAH